MIAWLRRLIGGPAQASRRASAPAAPPDAGAANVHAAAPTALAEASFGVRRPLIDRAGAVAGFEILLPPVTERRLSQRADAAVAANQIALLAAAAPLVTGGRAAMLRMPAAILARPAVIEAAVAGLLLAVDDLESLPPAAGQALRAKGVRLGFPDRPPAIAPATDFVLLQAGGGIDTALASVQRWHDLLPRLTMVATGLARLDDVERVLRGGVHLAGGQIGQTGVALAPREPSSAAHRICELLNQLALDRETASIAEAVAADMALTYRLLRYANSAAIGSPHPVETIDQAVQMLGRNELYRWLTVMLLATGEGRPASRALQEAALARGRLMEALARRAGLASPGTLFTVGLLSLLDVVLQTPLAAALQPLRLPAGVLEALLDRRGPWAGYLRLAEALEGGEPAAIEPLADEHGGLPAVVVAAGQAWAWAHAVADA